MTCSVVIPMYNAHRTIIATIQSCLQQTVAPHEIIVVDDCSTDDAAAQILQHFGTQITLIQQNHNAGPAAARNAGWNKASGNYVAFLDSDDQWHPRKLEWCLHALEQQSTIDLLWHYYQTEPLPVYANAPVVPRKTRFFDLLWFNPISTSCVVFRRDLPLRFNEAMRYCEDYELALRHSYRHSTYLLPLYLTQLDRPVLSAGGLSADKWKMRQGELKAYAALPKLHPGFYLLIPFLYFWSFAKHLSMKWGLRK
ncbi:hypothetical protein DBR32_13555 [Taibaiella sp. KBW10]|uniref:glycosyltransferase family 2 protein n=1 Tax=Taibaiella sp. KBW10 TaxID=2153357 RepID=UPI000F5A5111|nr:glycosyltransferase family A protein [Taibaiella sp. KBW10]RQO29940.1 hypothetical protein DBR32_13555 [Taibaiella sp. KBW10]